MPYTTKERVRLVLARNQDQADGTGAMLSDEQINDNIAEADREIDGKLSSVFATPFNPVPELIANLSRDIAAYLSDLAFREVRDYQSSLNPVVLRYQRAQDMLKALMNGSMDIPGVTISPDMSGSGQIVAAFSDGTDLCAADFDERCFRPLNRISGSPRRAEWWGIW
jgi:phage gp36-like protein